MKIAYTKIELPQGKMKYHDKVFLDLVEKFQPAKVSPYYFEFLPDDYASADIIAISEEYVLDLLILDMEKIEGRLERTEDPIEIAVLQKCQAHLDNQEPICDLALSAEEFPLVNSLGPLSLTPTVIFADSAPEPNLVCREGMEKAAKMFFYTVGKQEVHAWLVDNDTDAVTCAGKIHSDLARGFIKAEIVSCADMMTAYNMQEARTKKLTKLVDGDYIIPTNSILDIHFNV